MRERVDHAHEARIAAFVGTARQAVGVGRREEEHVATFDELAIAVVDVVDHQPLLDAIGEAARIEAILQFAAAAVIKSAHRHLRIDMRLVNTG